MLTKGKMGLELLFFVIFNHLCPVLLFLSCSTKHAFQLPRLIFDILQLPLETMILWLALAQAFPLVMLATSCVQREATAAPPLDSLRSFQ